MSAEAARAAALEVIANFGKADFSKSLSQNPSRSEGGEAPERQEDGAERHGGGLAVAVEYLSASATQYIGMDRRP